MLYLETDIKAAMLNKLKCFLYSQMNIASEFFPV